MPNKSSTACKIVSVTLLLIGLYLLWHMANIVLMLFGGLLWAIFLNKMTKLLQRYVPWGYTVSLTAVFVGLLGIFVLIAGITAPQVAVQGGEFVSKVSESWTQVETFATQFTEEWIQLQESFNWKEQLESLPEVVRKATTWLTAVSGGILTGIVALYIGTLIAYDPQPYKNGVLTLIPKSKKKRIEETLDTLKDALWRWLLGRFSSMLAVGVLTWIGLLILGMPLPFLLALIAGLLSFIPNIGIIIATSLALLLAFPIGYMMMLWVALLYVIVQMIEGNLITPFIEQHLMSLPAGIIIAGQIIFGFLFGFLGIMFATPLLVAIIVLVQKLYVEELHS